jgi:hypothetical protein
MRKAMPAISLAYLVWVFSCCPLESKNHLCMQQPHSIEPTQSISSLIDRLTPYEQNNGAIVVQVQDLDGYPFESAGVEIEAESSHTKNQMYTESTGVCVFQDLTPDATYKITATIWPKIGNKCKITATRTVVTSPSTVKIAQFSLPRACRKKSPISPYEWEKEIISLLPLKGCGSVIGIVREGSCPIEGSLIITNTTNGEAITTKTDSTGKYSIVSLNAGVTYAIAPAFPCPVNNKCEPKTVIVSQSEILMVPFLYDSICGLGE